MLDRYRPALRTYFGRRVGVADAEDLVQDVLVSIQSRRALAPIANVEAYLFTVASRVLAAHLKHVARSNRANQELPVVNPGADELSPERQAIARHELHDVKSAIMALPDKTREIFTLNRFEQLSYTSIAAHLGISVSTVEKHMMKAIRAVVRARRGRR